MKWFSSYGEDAEQAIKRLISKNPSKPKGLFAFLTSSIDPEAARKSLTQAFVGVPLIGCTATGTFTDEAVSGASVPWPFCAVKTLRYVRVSRAGSTPTRFSAWIASMPN